MAAVQHVIKTSFARPPGDDGRRTESFGATSTSNVRTLCRSEDGRSFGDCSESGVPLGRLSSEQKTTNQRAATVVPSLGFRIPHKTCKFTRELYGKEIIGTLAYDVTHND